MLDKMYITRVTKNSFILSLDNTSRLELLHMISDLIKMSSNMICNINNNISDFDIDYQIDLLHIYKKLLNNNNLYDVNSLDLCMLSCSIKNKSYYVDCNYNEKMLLKNKYYFIDELIDRDITSEV